MSTPVRGQAHIKILASCYCGSGGRGGVGGGAGDGEGRGGAITRSVRLLLDKKFC